MKIHPKFLLWIYICIPIALLLLVVDKTFLGGQIGRYFTTSKPDHLALFTLLFTLPHILSSFFGFLDKGYIQHYRKKLFRGLQLAVIGAVLLPIISIKLAFIVFAILTMYHVFRQQSGIAKSLMHGMNPYHNYWEGIGVVLSVLLYLDLYSAYKMSLVVRIIWLLAVVPYTYFGYRASLASKTSIGKKYFWITHLIPLVSGLFLFVNYPFLAIVVPRVIHDISAYNFYISHDYNRFAQTHTNVLYTFFNKLHLSVVIISPLLSVCMAVLIGRFFYAQLYIVLTILFLFHYYNESYMWRRDSLHRRYISFAS